MSKIISSIIIVAVLVFIVAAVMNKSKKEKTQIKEMTEETITALTTEKTISNAITIPNIKLTEGLYTISPKDISINWTGRKIVMKKVVEKGSISIKNADFNVDKDGSVISNSIVIDMNSIKTAGIKDNAQDRLAIHLKSADFFEIEIFPTAVFKAKELTASTTNLFILKGDLTLKDIKNEISIPITLDISKKDMIIAKGSVDLDRTLWNVRYGSGKFFENLGDKIIDDMFNVSFEVKVNISKAQALIESI